MDMKHSNISPYLKRNLWSISFWNEPLPGHFLQKIVKHFYNRKWYLLKIMTHSYIFIYESFIYPYMTHSDLSLYIFWLASLHKQQNGHEYFYLGSDCKYTSLNDHYIVLTLTIIVIIFILISLWLLLSSSFWLPLSLSL